MSKHVLGCPDSFFIQLWSPPCIIKRKEPSGQRSQGSDWVMSDVHFPRVGLLFPEVLRRRTLERLCRESRWLTGLDRSLPSVFYPVIQSTPLPSHSLPPSHLFLTPQVSHPCSSQSYSDFIRTLESFRGNAPILPVTRWTDLYCPLYLFFHRDPTSSLSSATRMSPFY